LTGNAGFSIPHFTADSAGKSNLPIAQSPAPQGFARFIRDDLRPFREPRRDKSHPGRNQAPTGPYRGPSGRVSRRSPFGPFRPLRMPRHKSLTIHTAPSAHPPEAACSVEAEEPLGEAFGRMPRRWGWALPGIRTMQNEGSNWFVCVAGSGATPWRTRRKAVRSGNLRPVGRPPPAHRQRETVLSNDHMPPERDGIKACARSQCTK